jgi:hypothetical protein
MVRNRVLLGALILGLAGCRQPASTPPSSADEVATLNALATAIQETADAQNEPELPQGAETEGVATAPLPTPDPLTVALAQTATAQAQITPADTPAPRATPTLLAPTPSPTVSDVDAAIDLDCRETLTRYFVFKAGDSRQALELLFVPQSLPLPDDPPGMIIRGRVLLDLQPAPDTVGPVAAGERIYLVRFSVDYDPDSTVIVANPRAALAYMVVDATGTCLIRTFTGAR